MLGFALPHSDLISTLAVSLVAALVFGFACRKLGLSPIVGYMIAGIVVGPHTPGFVANADLAAQLAEIGVALLMFGVGLHFSLRELLAVRGIAVPGAIGQSLAATLFGVLIGIWQGWGVVAGTVFGIAISVASTVVLMRGLLERRLLATTQGHVAVGWLVVEDLFTVVVLVLLPAFAPQGGGSAPSLLAVAGVTALEILAFGLVYVVGVRVVPWFLGQVSRLESRELFTLSVLAIALGIAYGSSALLGVSMALGAFLGGMVVGQSDLSHQAAADALPLRDAFAVLFFVSVGMLFDPAFVLERPALVLATLAVVMVVKPLAALAIAVLLGHPVRVGTTVGAGLGQIGEFSFILGGLGLNLKVLPQEAFHALLATALASIALQPLLFRAAGPVEARLRQSAFLTRWLLRRRGEPHPVAAPLPALSGHAVLCGAGRVGRVLCDLLRARGLPVLVVEQNRAVVQELRQAGVTVLQGDASHPRILDETSLGSARILLIAIGDPLATRHLVAHARRTAPELEIVARVHDTVERDFLARDAKVAPVLGELELSLEMARAMLERFGVGTIEAQRVALEVRRGNVAHACAKAQVFEYDVAPNSPALGKRLADLGLAKGTLVVAIRRGDDLIVPDGATSLAAGDRLFVTGVLDGLDGKI